MPIPWVSRAHYELLQHNYEKLRVESQHSRAWEDLARDFSNRFDALLEKYHALRTQGANPAEPKPEPRAAPEPDPVTQAILARAGKSQALRKHYYDFVSEQRRDGVSDDEIAHAILTGVDDDAGVPA